LTEGLLHGLAAYGWWGLLIPIYFKVVGWVPPVELLAQRILWSLLFLACLLTVTRRWHAIGAALRHRRTLILLCLNAVFLGINWLVYLYSVATDQMVQSGLGYFMLPLVNVVFGMLFLGERLRPWQWLAVGLAALGIVNLAMRSESWPWIALVLAVSFGLYGLLRKIAPVDGQIGLSIEVILLSPFAAALLIYISATHGSAWNTVGLGPHFMLACSGVMTITPLLCFGKAARLLPLTTLGFIQYLSPSLQCAVAVLVYGEPFGMVQVQSFACIWLALTVVSIDSLRARQRRAERVPVLDAVASS
jgi:chloramphenicol-sensitive protein RarD